MNMHLVVELFTVNIFISIFFIVTFQNLDGAIFSVSEVMNKHVSSS